MHPNLSWMEVGGSGRGLRMEDKRAGSKRGPCGKEKKPVCSARRSLDFDRDGAHAREHAQLLERHDTLMYVVTDERTDGLQMGLRWRLGSQRSMAHSRGWPIQPRRAVHTHAHACARAHCQPAGTSDSTCYARVQCAMRWPHRQTARMRVPDGYDLSGQTVVTRLGWDRRAAVVVT